MTKTKKAVIAEAVITVRVKIGLIISGGGEGVAEAVGMGEGETVTVGVDVGVGEIIGVDVGDGEGVAEDSARLKDMTVEWELNSAQYLSASCQT